MADDFCNFTLHDESSLYMVGFGYSFFLSILFLLSGKALLFTLVCQIGVASLSTVFIYKIGRLISGRRLLGIIAAGLNSFSPTALSLNTSFLSETIFFACIVLSIYIYLKIVTNPSIGKYILLGILVAYATFTRSVGQFLPLVFVAAAITTPAKYIARPKKTLILSVILSMSLSSAIITAWAFRNYMVNDSFVVAGTGPGAAAIYLGTRVAADRSDTLSVLYFRDTFGKELANWRKDSLNSGNGNEWFIKKVKTLFNEDPSSFIRSFMSIVWENMMASDQLSRLRLPELKKKIVYYTQLGDIYKFNKIIFGLSIFGFILLLINRKVFAALFLLFLYIYFALISGFTYWQGSRIFYPAQTSWALFVASAIFYPIRYCNQIFIRVNWKAVGNRLSRMIKTILLLPNSILKLKDEHYRIALLMFPIIALSVFSTTIFLSSHRSPVYVAFDGSGDHIFDGLIVLSRPYYELNSDHTHTILLDFYAKKEIERDYRIFFHLYPEKGGNMINLDFEPEPSVTQWKPFEIVTLKRILEMEPGTYGAHLGFFDSESRLDSGYSFMLVIR
ncbi:MAG: glycosyltransferase family 39 protein [candidate division Zixibacteria bacterium]|nr:glycosyltransferase family 39 protein [candidate division Zixibacteria bacterium]